MKKRYYFIIGYVLFVIVLGISIYKTFDPEKLGKTYNSLYKPLEYNIDIIRNNMNDITINDWSRLKKINLEDKQLENTYNLLLSDIKTCYLLSNDLENKTYKNLKIMSFKNKTYISDEELSELNKNENCLKTFDKYNSLVLSDDQRVSERIKTQIRILIDYKSEPFKFKNFDSLLSSESIIMSKIASLTNWLKVEYYSHKVIN